MRREIGYEVMKRIENLWGRLVELDVIDLGNEFYLVKFYSQEDLDFALLEGPWKIYDRYLVVRLWEPNFNPLLTTIDKITAWIRLTGLPIELHNEKILRNIGGLIGRICKVDYNTSHLCRGKFARLCVKVDLTKPLLGRCMVNGSVSS
ncbi:Endonuclease/exonuclease/phosphatase [Arachis hypogaea]|nr:Endonuclease/exonuclease/phosphatase [Arachis hypogaea]